MNDRFKFRVFYKPEKEMIYDAQATYDNACKGQGSFHHWGFQEVLEDKDCIPMQCTGLKDKNGKLIYEGDIVKFQHGNQHRIGAVEVYKCEVRVSNSNFCQGAWCGGALINLYETCEVIGNIHENKELLECQR